MKKKSTIVLMVLALLGILAAGLAVSRKTGSAEAEISTTLSLSVSVEDRLTVGGRTFESRDGTWVYEADPAFPLDQEKLKTMVTTLSSLEADRTLTAPGALSRYGLDTPLATVTVGSTTLSVGAATAMNGGTYFSLGDGAVYISHEDLLTPFHYDFLELAALETAPAMETLESVTLTRSDGTGWTVRNRQGEHLAYSDSLIWFLDTPGGPQVLDTQLTEALIRKATDLEFTGCAAFKPTDLSSLGLDSPTLTVSVRYTAPEEGTYTLNIGAAKSGQYYAQIQGSPTVYWMDAVPVNALRDSAPETLTPDEVLLLDADTLTAVTVRLAGETWRFTPKVIPKQSTEAAVDTTGQTETVWCLDDRETALGDVLTTLTAMSSTGSAQSLTPTRACELEFELETDDDYYPTVTLSFWRYSAETSLVTLNGTPTVLVSRPDAAALYEAVTAIVLE